MSFFLRKVKKYAIRQRFSCVLWFFEKIFITLQWTLTVLSLMKQGLNQDLSMSDTRNCPRRAESGKQSAT